MRCCYEKRTQHLTNKPDYLSSTGILQAFRSVLDKFADDGTPENEGSVWGLAAEAIEEFGAAWESSSCDADREQQQRGLRRNKVAGGDRSRVAHPPLRTERGARPSPRRGRQLQNRPSGRRANEAAVKIQSVHRGKTSRQQQQQRTGGARTATATQFKKEQRAQHKQWLREKDEKAKQTYTTGVKATT